MSIPLNFKFILSALLISGLLMTGCKTNEPEKKKSASLPAPPLTFLDKIFKESDYIDYMFDDFSFSVSVSDEKSVKGNVGYLSVNAVEDLTCTKPIGTVYFQANGEHICIARSYYGNGCAYFILQDKNNKPLYACQMSDSGKKFFKQIIEQTKTSPVKPQG